MNQKSSRLLKIVAKILAWCTGISLAILILLEIVLSGPIMTRIVNRYAADYVDGQLHFGKASVSLFKRFPAAVLTLDDFSITYPAERFDSLECIGAQGHLMHHGCSEKADTLASFRKFAVGINLPALLNGTINIPYMRLDKPRIFAHRYVDGSVNWDMFIFEETEEEPDTTESSFTMPKLVIGKIMMTEHPHIVYTDSKDTIFAMIDMKHLEANGKIDPKKMSRSKVGLTLDSLFVAGRVSRDTLAAGIDRLYLHEENKQINVDAAANAFLATRDFGRIRVPMNLTGKISFPKDSIPAVSATDLKLDIAHIPMTGEADIRFRDGITSVKADAEINGCRLNEIIRNYAVKIIPEAEKISTDAVLDMKLHIDGDYVHNTGQLPVASMELGIPDAAVIYSDYPDQELTLGFEINADINSKGEMNVGLHRLHAEGVGIKADITGKVTDLLGNDPEIEIDGNANAEIDSVMRVLPDSLGINASGSLRAQVAGKARFSQLSIYNFSQSSLSGELYGDNISVSMPMDTIAAAVNGVRFILGPEQRTSRRDTTKSIKLIGISGEIAVADISYKNSIFLRTKGFKVSAKNVMDQKISADSTHTISPFRGRIDVERLSLKDAEGTSLRITGTGNSFSIFPKRGQPETPVLTLSSRNEKIFLRYDVNRIALNDADFRVSAAMNTFERRKKMEAYRDSLAKVYPYIPKDSLIRHHWARSGKGRHSGIWKLQEDDFRDQDINISLDKSLSKYFREWDINGNMSVGNSYAMTPYFPLRNNLKGFDLRITNDDITINRLELKSGESELSATGKLSGLRRALLGRKGAMKLKVDISSDKINANELLAAYSKGAEFKPDSTVIADEITEEELMEDIAIDTAAAMAPSLIVIPGNLTADISINARNIEYSDLHIEKASADLTMKDRCVQISNTKAESNMGAISMEGFYATRSKTDIKTGFSLNFNNITAEKVIDLMPSIDTLMPLLKSFGGNLDCEFAATAQLDTNMNIVMPSINGIIRFSGDNMYIKENEMFRKMARMLLFKNKKEGHIDKMTVEGVIRDSKVEVFPFILEMDRYMLGLSGVQNMDMSFKYHASLIKSPFLIKLGMDIYGPDFDNMKFKIGKAKYKSKDVPVFSAEIDNTKINLVESIRNVFDKGVDAAINASRRTHGIEERKKKIGYVQAVDQEMEALSAAEQKKLEDEQNAAEQDVSQETVNE